MTGSRSKYKFSIGKIRDSGSMPEDSNSRYKSPIYNLL